jgi:hypothetical protein
MINHEHKVIFFHVGKAGGTSVEQLLYPQPVNPAICNRDILFGWDEEEKIYLQYATCAIVKRIKPDIFDKYYKFTVVRNPYLRTVSAFFYCLRSATKSEKYICNTFKKYVLQLSKKVNDRTYLHGAHPIAQIHYTHINGIQVVNHIAKLEEFPHSLYPALAKIRTSQKIPHLNINRRIRPSIQALYDDEMIAIMQEIFFVDFLTFDYALQPPIEPEAKSPTLISQFSTKTQALQHQATNLLIKVLTPYKVDVHCLHIGKTGGMSIKAALHQYKSTEKYRIHLKSHSFRLMDVPEGDKCVFVLRDPIQRFCSAFFFRFRESQPRLYQPWTFAEKQVFEQFSSPEDLAIALGSPEAELRNQAGLAMRTMFHLKTQYMYWLQDIEYINSRLQDIFFIGFQEQLNDDFERLKHKLKLPAEISLPVDDISSNKNPSTQSYYSLSPGAIENLKSWYEEDYQLFNYCRKIAPQFYQ